MKTPLASGRGRAAASRAIDDGRFVDIRGEAQWMTLRGRDPAHPALMMIAGPGGSFVPLAPLFAGWEADFTLVQWDQPGAGATLARNGPPQAYGLDRLVADGLVAAEAARAWLGVASLVLMGVSAGSAVALRMLKARPALFRAYVGLGQATHWARQEALSYELVLARARAADDRTAIAELEAVGPPPYAAIEADAVRGRHANALTPEERAAFDPALMAGFRSPPPDARWWPAGLAPPDPIAAATRTFERLKPELAAFDAAELGLAFEQPMIFLQGEHDLHTVNSEVVAYAKALRAPRMRLAFVRGGGHLCWLRPDAVRDRLRRHVLPLVRPAAG